MNSIHRRSLCSSPPAPPLDIAAVRRAAAPRDGPALKTVYETTQLRACVYYTTDYTTLIMFRTCILYLTCDLKKSFKYAYHLEIN